MTIIYDKGRRTIEPGEILVNVGGNSRDLVVAPMPEPQV
jgi:hypothetical protein